jgi:hypothetical protein
MAVREFTDAVGRQWRAWDVKPEAIHPATKTEDYLAEYLTGWIVFETVSGDEKRRLSPWPTKWMDGSEAYLRQLLGMAEVVPPHRLTAGREHLGEAPSISPSASAPAERAGGSPQTNKAKQQGMRTFRYPGGRFWAVCVDTMPEDGGLPVLRFTSGMRSIDVRRWRKTWMDEPDEALASMLREAAPRPAVPPTPDAPRRRWDDHPTE